VHVQDDDDSQEDVEPLGARLLQHGALQVLEQLALGREDKRLDAAVELVLHDARHGDLAPERAGGLVDRAHAQGLRAGELPVLVEQLGGGPELEREVQQGFLLRICQLWVANGVCALGEARRYVPPCAA